MTETPVAGSKVSYAAGQPIFSEGDPGGDLFLIKSGEVEVYKKFEGTEIELAVLKPGEILGVMTCLTRDPRLASARAKTDVEALIVKQAGFNKLVESTPQWVKTVIKDFIARIKHMDEMYGKAAAKLEALHRRTGNIAMAANIAAGLKFYANYSAVDGLDTKQAGPMLADILNCDHQFVEQVIRIFAEANLISFDGETRIRQDDIAKLPHFSNFSRSFVEAKSVPLDSLEFEETDAKVLLKLVEISLFMQLNMNSEVRLKVAKVKEEMAKFDKDMFQKSSLERAARLKLLSLDKGAEEYVRFTPVEVEIKVKAIKIWRLLSEIPDARVGERVIDTSEVQVITENF